MTAVGTTTRAPSNLLRRSILLFVGAAGVAGSLCVLFLCMRAVMEIGGSCASGNVPYEVSRPCPSGVPGLMTGSIFGGLVFLAVYALSTFSINLVLLAWPALFLSLGWNFFDYGIDPPFGDGVSAGWLICGVVFVLMGGVPLVIGVAAWLKGRETRWRTPDQDRLRERLPIGSTLSPPVDVEARERSLLRLSIVLHVAGIAAGLWGGIELFEWATGSQVSIGFR